jgi:hypothetical protein
MKLSELDPNEIEVVQPTKLKLSELNPDEITPIGASTADEVENVISKGLDFALPSFDKAQAMAKKVPIVGDMLQGGLETAEDAFTGAQNLGFGARDNIMGAIKGVGKTALEMATPLVSEDKFPEHPLEQLYNNYKKYRDAAKVQQEAASQRSPIANTVGDVAGGFVSGAPILKGAKALGLGAEGLLLASNANRAKKGLSAVTPMMRAVDVAKSAIPSAAMGGLAAYGNDQDVGTGIVAGGLLGPLAEQVIVPGITKGINAGFNALEDSTGAMQAAATLLNASKGGSVFGRQGPGKIQIRNQELAGETAEKISSGLKQMNDEFTVAFKAAEDVGKVLDRPGVNIQKNVSNLMEDLAEKRINLAPEQIEVLQNYFNGSLKPSKASEFIQSLKSIRAKTMEETLRNSLGNVISDLETATNKILDNTTLQRLNAAKSTAWKQVEPFIQKANEVVPDPSFHPTSGSDLSVKQINLRMKSLFDYLIDNAGVDTRTGIEAAEKIQQLQQILKDANSSVNFKGVNPSEIASNLQNQSYLNAALSASKGVRQNSSFKPANFLEKAIDKSLLWGTERMAPGNMLGSDTAKRISERLLGKDPLQMREAAMSLGKDSRTKKLAEELIRGQEINNNQRITNATFQILQNPTAKALLSEQEEEQ